MSACTCISSASTPIASTCVSRKSAKEHCSVAHTGSNVSRCARMWAEVTSRSHAIEPSAMQRSDEACNLIEPAADSSLAATLRRASAAARSTARSSPVYARDASEDESDVEDERGVEDEKGPWPVPPKQSADMLC